MIVDCIKVEYEHGNFNLFNGVKGGTRDHRDGNKQFTNRGSGWGQEVTSSKLNLVIDVEGKHYNSWVDKFFKDNLGKLTEKRRDIISSTMPQTIDALPQNKQDGSVLLCGR